MSADLEKTVQSPISPHGDTQHQVPSVAPTASTRTRTSRIGNSAPLGLISFGSTTLILSLYTLQTRGITTLNAVVGMALFCGGLAEFLAGMWAFPRGDPFGGVVYTSYGAFWMSYAAILIPGSGTIAAYTNPREFGSALGIYLITWGIVTFFFLIAALAKHWAFVAFLTFLMASFFCHAGFEFTGSIAASKAGGALGAIAAFIAFYIGLSELLASESQPIVRLPLGHIRRKKDL